jgi:hypothetical protein
MRVKVTKTITVFATATGNVHYEAGWEGTAPKDHVERIVAAGAGQQVGGDSAKADKTEVEAKK